MKKQNKELVKYNNSEVVRKKNGKSLFMKILPFLFVPFIIAFGVFYITVLGRAIPGMGIDEAVASIGTAGGALITLIIGFVGIFKK